MVEEIIEGLIYMKYDFIEGIVEPIAIPADLSKNKLEVIKSTTKSLLGKKSEPLPELVMITPLPGLDLKGMVNYGDWEEEVDDEEEGKIFERIRVGIAVIYKEAHDPVFYKYKKKLDIIFDDIINDLVELEKTKASQQKILETLEDFRETIIEILKKLELKEMDTEGEVEAFETEDDFDYKFKIAVCGEPAVGKTSLVLRFTDNAFKSNYLPTIGVNISEKAFRVNGDRVKLVIWDVAGQSKFNMMRGHFYLGSEGILLIFDLTDPNTLDDLDPWYQDIKKNLKGKQIKGFLIGNKSDLVDQRKVDSQTAEKTATRMNLKYIETSALTSYNVDDAFKGLARKLIKLIREK